LTLSEGAARCFDWTEFQPVVENTDVTSSGLATMPFATPDHVVVSSRSMRALQA